MNYDYEKYFHPTTSPAVAAHIRRLIALEALLPKREHQPMPPDKAAKLFYLAARNVYGDETILRALRAAQQPCDDETILAAHRLLASLEPGRAPRLDRIRVAELDGLRGECNNGYITICPRSDYYRAAQQGDLWPLVTLLHHEHFHALHGSSEHEAFAASLEFLQRHGAPQGLIDQVTKHAIEFGTE